MGNLIIAPLGIAAPPVPEKTDKDPMAMVETYQVGSKTLSASAPLEIGSAKSPNHLWFPGAHRCPDGTLVVGATTYDDVIVERPSANFYWSTTKGSTWSPPTASPGGLTTTFIDLPSGETLGVPYLLHATAEGMAEPGIILSGATRQAKPGKRIEVTGFPRPVDNLPHGFSSMNFFGDPVRSASNTAWYAAVYGKYKGDALTSVSLLESADGYRWTFRSVVAPASCTPSSREGPGEPALCRLKDGRLLCIFRQGDNNHWRVYRQTFSSDDGLTWTTPVEMSGPKSVAPVLKVLSDGTVLLFGGREVVGRGLWVWISADQGATWSEWDLQKHHQRYCPGLKNTQYPVYPLITTCYTGIAVLDNGEFLVTYDRWHPEFRLHVMRLSIHPARNQSVPSASP